MRDVLRSKTMGRPPRQKEGRTPLPVLFLLKEDEMKEVILSADGDLTIYSVPDAVAENLYKYCMDFNYRLQYTSFGEKYMNADGVYCYTEADFIDYLNQYVFPQERSEPIRTLGPFDLITQLPEPYRNLPRFNF